MSIAGTILASFEEMPINIGTYHIQPPGVHGLCFGSCFSGPLPLRSLILGPLSRVHFGESPVIRLYSEIDHTYLSIEAQCVSHHYPRWTATVSKNLTQFVGFFFASLRSANLLMPILLSTTRTSHIFSPVPTSYYCVNLGSKWKKSQGAGRWQK